MPSGGVDAGLADVECGGLQPSLDRSRRESRPFVDDERGDAADVRGGGRRTGEPLRVGHGRTARCDEVHPVSAVERRAAGAERFDSATTGVVRAHRQDRPGARGRDEAPGDSDVLEVVSRRREFEPSTRRVRGSFDRDVVGSRLYPSDDALVRNPVAGVRRRPRDEPTPLAVGPVELRGVVLPAVVPVPRQPDGHVSPVSSDVVPRAAAERDGAVVDVSIPPRPVAPREVPAR